MEKVETPRDLPLLGFRMAIERPISFLAMPTREEIVQSFNPNLVSLDNGNFLGLPFDYDTASLVLIGVPWEVTVSYHPGTAAGPQRVLDASRQLDIFDLDNPDGWKQGIFMAEISEAIWEKSNQFRAEAVRIIEYLEQGVAIAENPQLLEVLQRVNRAGAEVNQWLFEQAQAAMSQGKQVAVIGGDHSVPLGLMRAIAHQHPEFGILHIDAHADLREAYEGFEFSHASIMFNALKLPQLKKLVQVGIRDLCHDEVDLIQQSQGRVVAYYDSHLKQKQYAGMSWIELCQQMVAELPQKVYISFDVDGLDPKLCPHTGTPVPGGLELEQTFALFREVIRSGRQIVGFDVNEVGDAEWDGNVAARTVYKLCNLMALSHSVSA